MKKEKSCGAVLYFDKDGKRYFLIEKMNMGHYSLVKGHVENDETEEETALREIKEETSLDAVLDTNFRNVITYSPFEGITKDVVFFVGKIVGGSPKEQLEEVSQILFLEYEDALKTLTFESDKDTLRKAYEYLK